MINIIPIKTCILYPPKDDILRLFDTQDLRLNNGDVLCIATKCLSIAQGRCVRIGSIDKQALIDKESDNKFISQSHLTVKDGTIIPYSGIDESNGNGYYILWPQDVISLLQYLHNTLCERFDIASLGMISVDSTISPLRRGTVGVAQGTFGFQPIKECIGQNDIFGRPLQMTSVNIADTLATIACYSMGESNEQCPLVIIRGCKNIIFTTDITASRKINIQPDEDFYTTILQPLN